MNKKTSRSNRAAKPTTSYIVVSVFAVLTISILWGFLNLRKSEIMLLQGKERITPVAGQAAEFKNIGFNDSYFHKAYPTRFLSESPFTVEAWVNIPQPSIVKTFKQYPIALYTKTFPKATYEHILFKFVVNFYEGDNTSYTPMFSTYIDNPLDNPTGNNYNTVESKVGLKVNTWNHIAITSYSQGDYCMLEMFQNGTLVATAKSTVHSRCATSTRLPKDLFIGKSMPTWGNPQDYFEGQLDSLRFSNVRRYTSSFTPTKDFVTDSATTALYNFEGNLTDQSGNNNNLTSQGSHFSFIKMPIMTLPKPSGFPSAIPIPSGTATPALW
jgi:hypothetical protein